MTTNKRKRSARFRGSRMHGRGIKKGRGAGNRGGRGLAGTGKRAAQKKPSILTTYGNAYFGKHGFNRPEKSIVKVKTINLDELSRFNTLEIDLTAKGYDKLLGSGIVRKPYRIKVASYSKKAKEKIEKAHGAIE